MDPHHSPARVARFGVFELDLRTGELRKRGLRVHLQEQPFQVLAQLVERAGDLVTREELRSRLWSDAVFVDFDQGLNKAILKIRLALGDSAESPRFVETLERRGYRFIACVDWSADDALFGSPSRPSRVPEVIVRLIIGDRAVALTDGAHVVGREPGTSVCIDAAPVSRQHARIVVAGAQVTIEDLGSRNGTFVNGARIAGVQPLSDGDALGIGTVPVRVRLVPGRTVTA